MRWVPVVLLFLLVLPAAGQAKAPSDPAAAANAVLLGPLQAVEAQVPAAVNRTPADQALAAHAYRSALLELSEQTALVVAEAAWDDAQRSVSPAQAFNDNLTATYNAMSDSLVATSARLQNLTAQPLTATRTDHLLVAANLLVEAEAERQAALAYLGANQKAGDYSHPVFRYTLARPVVGAQLLDAAADKVLDGVPAPDGDAVITPGRLARLIESRGGTPPSAIPEGGPLHALARHAHAYMGERGNATYAQVQAAAAAAPGTRATLQGLGLEGSWAAAVELDAAWWLGRLAATPDDPVQAPMMRTLNATLAGSALEAALLHDSASPGLSFAAGPWLWGTAGVGAVLIAGASWTAARRRK